MTPLTPGGVNAASLVKFSSIFGGAAIIQALFSLHFNNKDF
jgi:hypothetical protein